MVMTRLTVLYARYSFLYIMEELMMSANILETRWLSLIRVVSRVLELWVALVSYFTSHPEAEKRGCVKSIKERLCDAVKHYLLFLNFLLPTVNAFNVAFQATSYTTIHLLHLEMRKLTKRILRYFVIADRIDVADVTATMYQDRENKVMDDDLEVGETTRMLALELTEQGMEHVVSAFFEHVRLFYCAFVSTLMKKSPFQSSLLSDLRVIQLKGWDTKTCPMLRFDWLHFFHNHFY